MVLRRRELPIVGRCPIDAELRADAGGRAWCEHCRAPVHVLAGMREREVRALLAAHEGRSLCVEYRARADGSIALRPEPARAWLAPALAGLAACGHARGATMPVEAPQAQATGCPPPAPAPAPAASSDEVVFVANFRIDPQDEFRRGMIVIDRTDHHRSDRSDRLEWIPTKKLWKDFVARVRARRASAAK
ncbi:MAG TPA: hypothetical protein VG755_15170 [Nannocystaceae bacterium]|nr:hypothetical protein [Nannocystaceae bacterium]